MSTLKNLGLYLLYWALRAALSLRYKITVVGLREVRKGKKQSLLFLPNHSAEIDPILVMQVLWPFFKPKPLAVEHFYYQKGIRFVMDLVGALPLPTMDVANQWKVRQVEKLKETVLMGLKRGTNFLIYPSGKLKRTAEEKVYGASFVPDLLAIDPDVDIVLIRTTGLWGSSFSCAFSEGSPDFGEKVVAGWKTLLKNGIFFTPRRKVQIELQRAPADFPRAKGKNEVNLWLENWYNAKGPEPLSLVSTAFWKQEVPQPLAPQAASGAETGVIPKEIEEEIRHYLGRIAGKGADQIERHDHLSHDLGLDSIDIAQLYIYLEERFEKTEVALGALQTVQDLMLAAIGEKKEGIGIPFPKTKKPKWPDETARPLPHTGEENTIQEAFLKMCDQMGGRVACGDAISGVLSYKKLKRTALVLSLRIAQMPGEKIGILLPSSVGAYVAILATLLAGKVPVMLNWTTGARNLEHAALVCSLKCVLSSYRFLGRLQNVDMGRVDDLLILLEEVRRTLSFKEKIKGVCLSFRRAKGVLKRSPRQPKPDDWAVVIFTTGTETLPKGVPLTHSNILSNQKAALSCVDFKGTDLIYGVLPPFHSFGFSATGLLPLLTGLKVFYAPDPTNARGMASDIEAWKPTLLCSAPSFVQQLVRVAKEGQFRSVRMVVMGAEKVPADLCQWWEGRGVQVREGYGVSECSPIVTLERAGEGHKGVGKPLPGVELCVIDPESSSMLQEGGEGEVCIRGPSVFGGYLGTATDPFINLQGKRWYRSGDRGMLDKDGTLILTGRLKRFVKIGGEMVSLGGLEKDIVSLCKQKKWVPEKEEGVIVAVTVVGRESDKPQIVVFTTLDLVKGLVNEALKDMGHGRLVKITEIYKIKEIPLSGSGKIAYHTLDEQVPKGESA